MRTSTSRQAARQVYNPAGGGRVNAAAAAGCK